MATTFEEKLRKIGRRATGSDIESIVRKFNKDFVKKTNTIIDHLKFSKEKQIEFSKRARLRTIAQPQVPSSRVVGRNQTLATRSIDGVSTVQVVKELQQVNKQLGIQKKAFVTDGKIQKKNLRSGIIQAKIIQTVLGKAKSFFIDGPSIAVQQLNAIQNVERAILGQDPVRLDTRNLFEKILDNAITNNKTVGKIFDNSVTSEEAQTKLADIVAGKVKPVGTAGVSGVAGKVSEKVSSLRGVGFNKDRAAAFFSKFSDTISDTIKNMKLPINKEVEEKIKGTASSFATSLNDGVAAFIDKNFSKGKSIAKQGAIGVAFATFADIFDIGFSKVITNPVKTLKMASKTFKFAMNNFMDASTEGRFITAATLFGTLPGLVLTGLNPVLKTFRFMFGDRGTVPEIFKDMKKSMGKRFKKTKKWLALKGAGMISFIGTAMSVAMSFIPVIISAAIAAWPFILGGLIIAAVVGVSYYVYKNWDKVKASFQTYIVDPLVGMFDWVVESISGLFSSIGEKIQSTLRASGSIGSAVADFMFGESADESATDKTQMGQSKVSIEKNIINNQKQTDNSEEIIKQLKKIEDATLKSESQAATPPPSSNIEDVATYIVTQ